MLEGVGGGPAATGYRAAQPVTTLACQWTSAVPVIE